MIRPVLCLPVAWINSMKVKVLFLKFYYTFVCRSSFAILRNILLIIRPVSLSLHTIIFVADQKFEH
jgi:hypothetical protein